MGGRKDPGTLVKALAVIFSVALSLMALAFAGVVLWAIISVVNHITSS